jgi:hypothetical protein
MVSLKKVFYLADIEYSLRIWISAGSKENYMAFSKQFVQELDKLFQQRTHWLRSELKLVKRGQPPKCWHKKTSKDSIECSCPQTCKN